MNRGYYNTETEVPYYTGEEPGMDCIQIRHHQASSPSVGPFHYLISEQAKSLVALQELQHEVGALLEFRDLVIETFPNLRTKLVVSSSPSTSLPNTMLTTSTTTTATATSPSNIPISTARDWIPGVRVRKKITNKDDNTRNNKKIINNNNSETNTGIGTIQDSGFSTETCSKETHSASSTTAPNPSSTAPGPEDELWSLLDIIHTKGTRLKDQIESLQQNDNNFDNFDQFLFHSTNVRQLRLERDLLLDRLAEMEANVLANRVHTNRLQDELDNLIIIKHDLEKQLSSHLLTNHHNHNSINIQNTSNLDLVYCDKIVPKVKSVDSEKIKAILQEFNPIILQKYLLITTIQNQSLRQQLNTASRLEISLADKLDRAREENDELCFQLKDVNIELEGTRARARMLEQLHNNCPTQHTKIEISPSSMKLMSPLHMMDHSSSTESAHDQTTENNRKNPSITPTNTKRKPSKIPLKSYTAPKPPLINNNKSSPCTRESFGRPHSAQSCRNRSEANSLSGGSKNNSSLPKSRNGSLISAKDSLSCKLRSSDSLSNQQSRGTLRSTTPIKWTKDTTTATTTDKVWTEIEAIYPDSLEKSSFHINHQIQNHWNITSLSEFYDSIDLNSSSCHQNNKREDFAEYDSLNLISKK